MTEPRSLDHHPARRAAAILCTAALLLTLGAAARAQSLDVDDDGTVDVFTDIIYIARTLLGLPPVPPSFRDADPNIPPDPTIAARVEQLLPTPGPPTPTRTVTPTATASGTATGTATASSTATASHTATRTGTRTDAPTISPTPSRTATTQPTPEAMEGTNVVQGAAEVAVQNEESLGALCLGCTAALSSACCNGRARMALEARTAPRAADALGQVPRGASASCAGGGSRTDTCQGDTQTIQYQDCAEPAAPGSENTVTRNGTTTLLVERPQGLPRFCDSGMVVDPFVDTVTLTLTDYEQFERNGDDTVATLEASQWIDRFAPSGAGCVPDLPGGGSTPAANGVQTLRGALRVFCQPGAESVPCRRGGTDLTLTVLGEDPLRVERTSGGFPCELGMKVNGELRVDDRDQSFFGEDCRTQFAQRFADFFLFETPDASGTTAVRQEGTLSVDVLGDLQFETRLKPVEGVTPTPGANGSIEFSDNAQCPTGGDGQLRVRRPPKTVAAAEPTPAALTRGIQDPSGELRHTLFRAQSGQVYQVIQNLDRFANFGAESLRITTLIGSEAGGVGQCSVSAGATVAPQGVAGAAPGEAFPPDLVRKVPSRIPFAGNVTFDQNFDGGRGRVCIGPDCTFDASCPSGGACRSFTQSQGIPIETETDDIPAATLAPIPVLDNPCAGFGAGARNGNFLTYRFGPADPTVQVQQCELVDPPGDQTPRDGFRLPNGSSVIFVYEASFASLFNAAVAGFPVDENDSTSIGCQVAGDRFLHLGTADAESVEAPLVEFSVQNGNPVVTFDYEGDGTVDDSDFGCVNLGSPITQCNGEVAP